MNSSKTLKAYYSLFLLITFISSQFTPALLAESNIAASAAFVKLPQDLHSIKIPAEWGQIEDSFSGNSGKQVIIIQDAHAVADAQKNIQKLIGFFEKEFGVQLVGVEGVSSELDPQIFKSFPDKKLLAKTLEDYFKSGELTGSSAAALLNETPAHYQGIEDWALYEKGLKLFLEAKKNNTEVLDRVKLLNSELQARKEKVYSPELLEIDRVLRDFYSNGSNLIEALKKLSEFKLPEKNSELAAFLEQSQLKEEDGQGTEKEVREMASAVRKQLKKNPDITAFNEKEQGFKTSQISAQEFALFLKEKAAENGIAVKLSGRAEFLVNNQKKMRDVEGTQFFKSFENYAGSVKELFLKDEKLKALDRETRRLELFERMAELQLTHEEWVELKTFTIESELEKVFKRQSDFYVNAEERDGAFYKKILQLMYEQKTSASLMIAGGFHSDGIRQLLKDKEISYLLVRPKIESLPENNVYLEHMNGNVSWKKYFKVENGKVNVYQAFVRAVRDKLLSVSTDAPGKLLKTWRDQIIRDLASIHKVSSSGKYTKFMDEAAKPDNEMLDSKLLKVDEFIDALQKLETQGKLNGQNALSVLRPSSILDAATAGVLAPNDSTFSLLRQDISPETVNSARSELRALQIPAGGNVVIKITDLQKLDISVGIPGSEESWRFYGVPSGKIVYAHTENIDDEQFGTELKLKVLAKTGGLEVLFNGEYLLFSNKRGEAVNVEIKAGAQAGNGKASGQQAQSPAVVPQAVSQQPTLPLAPGEEKVIELTGSSANIKIKSISTNMNGNPKIMSVALLGPLGMLYTSSNDGETGTGDAGPLKENEPIEKVSGIIVERVGNQVKIKNQSSEPYKIELSQGAKEVNSSAAPAEKAVLPKAPPTPVSTNGKEFPNGQILLFEVPNIADLEIEIINPDTAEKWSVVGEVILPSLYYEKGNISAGFSKSVIPQKTAVAQGGVEVFYDGNKLYIRNIKGVPLNIKKIKGVNAAGAQNVAAVPQAVAAASPGKPANFLPGSTRYLKQNGPNRMKVDLSNPANANLKWSLTQIGGTYILQFENILIPTEGTMGPITLGVPVTRGGVTFTLLPSGVVEMKNSSGSALSFKNFEGAEEILPIAIPAEQPPAQSPQNLQIPAGADAQFETFRITDYFITTKIQDGYIFFIVNLGGEEKISGPFKLADKKTFKFGRESSTADVLLNSDQVSRQHALVSVSFDNGNYKVELKDLGSMNHTYVAGIKVNNPVFLGKVAGTPGALPLPIPNAPAPVQAAPAVNGILPLGSLDAFLKAPSEPSSQVHLEYDLKKKKVTSVAYKMKHGDSQIPAGDPRVAKAFSDFDEFEDINYEVLKLMSKSDLALADWKQLRILLTNMVEAYQKLYKQASDASPSTFELVAQPPAILERILKDVEDEIKKVPSATRPVKSTDPLPKSVTDLIRKIDPALTQEIIGVAPGRSYKEDKLRQIGFHELINVVHQKGIRNLLHLILSFNVGSRKLDVTQRGSEDPADLSIGLKYIDAREKPDANIPLPMQHVAMAFAKGQRVHEHQNLFSPASANIYADEQQAGIRMRLGVHSARVQYAYQPTQEKGRIVVNYQDSYENDPRSFTRVGVIKGVLESLGFKVVVSGIRLDAYYDKDSAKVHSMNEMPDKLAAVIQLLSMVKDWDLKFGSADRDEIAAKMQKRLIEDGYIGPLGMDWRNNTELFAPKLTAKVQNEMEVVAKAAEIDLGEKPFGQRDLDYLNEEILRLLARGAIRINSQGRPEPVNAYKEAALQSPIETLLKMMQPNDKAAMDSMRAVAAIATAAKYFGQSRVIGDVRGYQVVKMVLPLAGDQVTFYLLKDPESGMFRLGYAVLGDIFYGGERTDRFRRKKLNGNLLNVKDLEEILAPQNVVSGQALLDWLDSLGLRAKHSKNNIFKIFNQEPGFLDQAIPEFDMDTLKYGAVRSTISSTSVGGMPINQGKAIGRAVRNRAGMNPAIFKGAIFIDEVAEVHDDEKMENAEAIVVMTGGPLAHAAVQAREKGKPALILNGAELTPQGIEFQTYRGKAKRKKISLPDAGGMTFSDMTFTGGSEVAPEKATVENGDLVYVDADNGMLYLLAKADDMDAVNSSDAYRKWKQSSEKNPDQLKAILAGIKNENLFRALVDELVSSNLLDPEKLQGILSSFLTDAGKKEIILVFFERRLRSAQGKFIKAYNELIEMSSSNAPDMLAVYLVMERLRVYREALQAFMKIFEIDGEQHPIREDMEKRWRMVRQIAQGVQATYRQKVFTTVQKILAEESVINIKRQLEGSKAAGIDIADASSLLSRVSRLRENVELADFPDEQLKAGVLKDLADLEAKLKTYRETQSVAVAGDRKVIGKDELMNMAARGIAGGKTDNSGAMRRALKNLPLAFPNLNFTVRNPDGFAVLASNYFAWQKSKKNDPQLKKDIASAYFELVNKQRVALLQFLETDTETAPDFSGYLKSVLDVNPEDVNDAIVKLWRATFSRFISQNASIASLALRNRLQVFASVAVRSSGLKEDSKDAAMAGQKETKLNVSGVDNIAQAVVDVWESGAEGVLVDEMTNPEAAILVFSTDAVTKEQNIRLTAGHGLTKGLVDSDGVPDPDVIVLKRVNPELKADFKIISNHIGDKSRGVVLDLEKGGTKTVGISEIFPEDPGKARQATLSADQIQTVARVAEYLSRAAGYPLDIEGGFQGNELLIFQQRPITTVNNAVAQAKELLRRSELRKQLTQAVEGVAAVIENPALNSATADQIALVISNYKLEDLRTALKDVLKTRSQNRVTTGTAISDAVFSELTEAALNVLGTPVDSQMPGLAGTVGFILNDKEAPSNSFVADFMKILGKSNVKTVVISGKGEAANKITKGVKGEGRTPYPIKSVKQRMVLDTNGPVPALVLDPSAAAVSETFLRFVVKNEEISDTLAEDFAGFLGAWCAVRSAELLSADPNRFKDRQLLRAQLLKDLFVAGIDAGAILSDSNGEFQIKTALAKVFLQARSEQRVAQAA